MGNSGDNTYPTTIHTMLECYTCVKKANSYTHETMKL